MTRVRTWVWPQLIIGWLPIWALYTTLIATSHPDNGIHRSAFGALASILVAALLGLLVQRLTERLLWPRPLTARFIAIHLVGAAAYASARMFLSQLVQSHLHPGAGLVGRYPVAGYLVLGVWLYVMVAGVAYAAQATERAAKAEAAAARAQLAALRSQLQPHFLFNALHTVVQLIPREPKRAAQAAEQLAGLLRTTVEEDRDLVTVAEELAFIERYLDLERIRFGDRLEVEVAVSDAAAAAVIPSFALVTLVENSVRHGAAPRIEPTLVRIDGRVEGATLVLVVEDGGVGARAEDLAAGKGTGLRRLRERLTGLYGGRATLSFGPRVGGGLVATLRVPASAPGDDWA
jgi:signal transduction histidine kinase